LPDELPPSKELPWQVTPESVSSIPPEVAAPPPPKPGRRAPAPAFRLLDHGEAQKEEKKPEKKPKAKPRRRTRRTGGGPWLKRLVVLALLGGVVGGGYWYFEVKNPGKPRPWAGLVERAKKLVSRSTPPARRPAPPRPTAIPPAATPPPAPVLVPVPVAQPTPPPALPPPVASPFARFDRLSDSLTRMVRSFQDRAGLFDSGKLDCNGLANGLVAVETTWLVYFNERKARLASLDQPRVDRDQQLYAAVDAVARRFEGSGCPRP
jgi:hypothetical protein